MPDQGRATEVPRVRLRRVGPADVARFAAWAQDVEVRRCFLGSAAVDGAEAGGRDWVPGLAGRPAAQAGAARRRGHLVRTIETMDGVTLGWIELRDANWRRRSGELRVCLGDPATWGRGFGTGAIRLFLDLAFGLWGLESVHLRVATWNLRAVRAYERCGFRREALLRAGARARDGLEDLWLMRLGAADWLAARGPAAPDGVAAEARGTVG